MVEKKLEEYKIGIKGVYVINPSSAGNYYSL